MCCCLSLAPLLRRRANVNNEPWTILEHVNTNHTDQGIEIDGVPSANTVTLKTIALSDSFGPAATAAGATPFGSYQNAACGAASQCTTIWEIVVTLKTDQPHPIRKSFPCSAGPCHVDIPSQ